MVTALISLNPEAALRTLLHAFGLDELEELLVFLEGGRGNAILLTSLSWVLGTLTLDTVALIALRAIEFVA